MSELGEFGSGNAEVGMREHSAEGLAHGEKKVRISQLNVNLLRPMVDGLWERLSAAIKIVG